MSVKIFIGRFLLGYAISATLYYYIEIGINQWQWWVLVLPLIIIISSIIQYLLKESNE